MTTKPYIITFQEIGDEAIGYLNIAQAHHEIPFEIKRVYWVHQTPPQIFRGGHANKTNEQVVICVQGRVEIELQHISGEKHLFMLTKANQGLFIPALHWRRFKLDPETILVCVTSKLFEENDYIRDYDLFCSLSYDKP